jgi:hypothetical protein
MVHPELFFERIFGIFFWADIPTYYRKPISLFLPLILNFMA